MKTAQCVVHTSVWTGVEHSLVNSYARYIREVGLLASFGKGPGQPEMTCDEMITLFTAVLACSSARSSPSIFPQILSVKNVGMILDTAPSVLKKVDHPKMFSAKTLKEALVSMFKDIRTKTIEDYASRVESSMRGEAKLTPERPFDLNAEFHIDKSVVRLRLDVNLTTRCGPVVISRVVGFGEMPSHPVPGEGALIRRLDYARLKGWGIALP